jgi:putative DNA primase/helicase
LTRYAAIKRLPVAFLVSLGLSDLIYQKHPSVRIPYRAGGTDDPVRFRIAAEGDKFRWKSEAKPSLYGLWRLGDARSLGRVTLCEGESDTQTLWLHDEPTVGLPGANS